MFEERINRILRKLEQLRALGSHVKDESGFGFMLHPVLGEAEVATFESKHGIRLPEDYRAFLTLAGDGGAGPGAGLLQLSKWNVMCLENEDALLAKPSPLTPAIEDVGNLNDYFGSYLDDWGQGAISISSDDDQNEVFPILIVTGESRGRVAHAHICGEGGFFPDNPDFLSWYERWIDDRLEGREDTDWGGMQGKEPELAAALRDRSLSAKKRLAAFRSIKTILAPNDETVRAIVGALRDDSPELRGWAAFYLGFRRFRNTESEIRSLLVDSDPEVRFNALWAMTHLKVPDLESLCRSCLRNPSERLAQTALYVLRDFGATCTP